MACAARTSGIFLPSGGGGVFRVCIKKNVQLGSGISNRPPPFDLALVLNVMKYMMDVAAHETRKKKLSLIFS